MKAEVYLQYFLKVLWTPFLLMKQKEITKVIFQGSLNNERSKFSMEYSMLFPQII